MDKEIIATSVSPNAVFSLFCSRSGHAFFILLFTAVALLGCATGRRTDRTVEYKRPYEYKTIEYMMNVQPDQAGLVFIVDLQITENKAKPAWHVLETTFFYRKFTEEELMKKVKINQDLIMMTLYSSAGSFPVKTIGCAALPEGEYFLKPTPGGQTGRLDEKIIAINSGWSLTEKYVNLLATGAAKVNVVRGKAAVVWMETTRESGSQPKTIISSRVVGTIPDPVKDIIGAQEQLLTWFSSKELARQYIAVLLLGRHGNDAAIGPLDQLAKDAPDLASVAREAQKNIKQRTTVSPESSAIDKSIAPAKESLPVNGR
jgi:hypothetical protein